MALLLKLKLCRDEDVFLFIEAFCFRCMLMVLNISVTGLQTHSLEVECYCNEREIPSLKRALPDLCLSEHVYTVHYCR